MERIEILQLMGFTEAEAIAKAAEEEAIRAKFRTASRKPEPVKAAKPRVRGTVNEAGTFSTATTDANGEAWGHFYNPKGFGC